MRKDYKGADIVTYLPIDTVGNARRFLRTVRPVMAFFVKYEFWYNYLHILNHRGVPTYSVSSIFRPGQIFFRPYGRQYGRVLRCFSRFFVQNEESSLLLSSIGIDQVEVVGDTRFDRVLQVREARKQLPLVERFVGDSHRVFVAGSSWLPDEELFLRYFASHPEWKLIIAPHVEAAVWGMPVLFGPNNKHFQEAQGLIAAQGGFEVSDDAGFAQLMDRFTKDEAFLQESAGRAAAFVEKLTGATERVLQAVKPELEKNCQAQS